MTSHFKLLALLAAISAIVVALLAPAASAQTAATPPAAAAPQDAVLSTPAFARLVQGKTVWVTTIDGWRRQRRVRSFTPTGMIVERSRLPVAEIPFVEIAKVERVPHRLRNSTLVGLAIGAGVGGAFAAAMRCCIGDEISAEGVFFGFALYTGMGVGIGAGVGALRHARGDEDVLYDAKKQKTTVALAPILSPTRKGLGVAITWR